MKRFSDSAGFTLLEALAIIAMLGVISAIAAPSWLAFLVRQRLNTARNEVLQMMTSAQVEASREKSCRTISFGSDDGVPTLTITWKEVGTGQSISRKQLIAMGQRNLRVAAEGSEGASTISFNHKGNIENCLDPANDDIPLPFVIELSAVDSAVPPRCVVVNTLLGSMATAEGEACDAWTTAGP